MTPAARDDRAGRSAARTRRRFARRQWRRRWLHWKPLLVLLVSVAIGATGVWAVLFSSWLAVRDVEVRGTSTLTAQEVLAAALVPEGRPLARVDVEAAQARVGSLAPVRSVRVSRAWPHTVVVAVTERTPVAVVSIGDRLRSLDADGVVFGSYDQAPPDLPVVRTAQGITTRALREAATVVATLPPEVARRVDHVEVRTVDEITLALRDGRTVEWGSSADSASKAQVLTVLLTQDAQVYDVSVPGQPVTRPRP